MSRTEELLRETYTAVGERAPDASPVLARVLRATRTRQRRRRVQIAVGLGAAVLALVIPLTTWPRVSGPARHDGRYDYAFGSD